MSDKAIVLLSGGVDSTTCLAIAVDEFGAENVSALSVFYGQKHHLELELAVNIASKYGVDHQFLTMQQNIFQSAESSLTGEAEMPHLTYQEIAEGEGVSPTYVPFRNGNLLSQATALAMTIGASWVYAGMHAEDARGWAYPDCTGEFLGAMAAAIYVGTYHKVRLVTPFQWASKADIIAKGLELGVPYEMTHSCYEGTRPSCGECPTCVERIGAFLIAGAEDPIEYKVDWRANIERYALA